MAADKQQKNWNAIEAIIKQDVPLHHINWRRQLMMAASLLLLIASTVWYIQSRDFFTDNLYKTDFAKVKNIVLPDGSKVILNANSQLKVSKNWGDTADRQVWLEGEAYFEVAKKQITGQKFIVHTKDLSVEVLGTKFNVNARHEKALVSLEEGKIKLIVNTNIKTALKEKYQTDFIEMKPGELVKLDTVEGLKLIAEENINYHSGWVRNEFHFNNNSLQEIASMIKDVYGYNMQTDDDALLKYKIKGDLRAASLGELVIVLQEVFKLKMTVEKKSIKISRL